MLPLSLRRAERSALLLPAPNNRSNAARGLRIIGSGSVGEAQLIVSV
jgi:hypothetical protein